jgi:hypothetical protein
MHNAGSSSFARGLGRHRKSKLAIVFASAGFVFALASGAASAATTIEAESMALSGGYAVDGTLIKLATANSGGATQAFGGQSGLYKMEVFVGLEDGGRPKLNVYRGSALLKSYRYPLGQNGQIASFTIDNVSLVAGDSIRLAGTANGSALARVDKVVMTPLFTPTVTTSAAGTSIPPAAQIVDASKAVWTVSGGVVYRNGATAGYSANVVQLYWNGSAIYQQNSAGGWWSWNGSDWVVASNPTSSSTTSTSTGSTSTGSTSTGSTSTGSTTPPPTSSLPSTGTRAVATFESLGLYWTPPSDPGSAGCEIQYKKTSDTTWNKGLNMWFDSRYGECRGSIVMLAPNTSYEVQFAMPGQSPVAGLVATTWSEQFPIAKTVYVSSGSQTLNITQGGSPSGYVLYTPAPGTSATIDVGNGARNNITVSAPYVIVRGLTLKGATNDGIDLLDGAHDVVIEDNDISGWGRYSYTNSAGWDIGVDSDSAIRCRMVLSVVRTVIQRNTIHDPRYGANSWSWGHPGGPQGTTYDTCGGNHVFRYNTIYSSYYHYYNDGIGGSDNITDEGFPREDSDIYGNKISQTWDDGIEAEGRGMNIRIWGNYLDNTTTGVATTVVNRGPAYIFRNVYNRSRQMSERAPDDDDRNTFAKSGTDSGFGDGRRYVFHNTLLQAPPPSGSVYTSGAGSGMSGPPIMTNTVSRNNIFHIWKAWWSSIASNGGSGNDADYDLYNGNTDISGSEVHGIVGTPIYQTGNGWSSEAGGMYQLAPNSPGYDAGLVIPNFNDGFTGAGPDMGAHEAGTPAMKFGVQGGTKEY